MTFNYADIYRKELTRKDNYKTRLAAILNRHELYDYQQQTFDAIFNNDTIRFVIDIWARRMGKTVQAAELLAESFLRGDRSLYISPSPSQTNETWNILNLILRNILKDHRLKDAFDKKYRRILNPRIIHSRQDDYNAISLQTSSDESTLRGQWADLVILDEYAYQNEGIFQEVVRPMLIDTQGKCLIISTPPNPNKFKDSKSIDKYHLIKWWFELKERNDPRYLLTNRPLTDKPDLPKDELKQLRLDQDPVSYRVETLAEISDITQVRYFNDNNFKYLTQEEIDKLDLYNQLISVDPSGSASGDEYGVIHLSQAEINDEEAFVVIADKSAQQGPSEQAKKIAKYADKTSAEVYIESNFGGDSTQDLINSQADIQGIDRPLITNIHTTESKQERASRAVPLYQHGKVYHHINLKRGALERQMLNFTANLASSPDRVDALVHGLNKLNMQRKFVPSLITG